MTEARCVETDCRGVAVSQGRCVGHVDEDGLASYVARVASRRDVGRAGSNHRRDSVPSAGRAHLLVPSSPVTRTSAGRSSSVTRTSAGRSSPAGPISARPVHRRGQLRRGAVQRQGLLRRGAVHRRGRHLRLRRGSPAETPSSLRRSSPAGTSTSAGRSSPAEMSTSRKRSSPAVTPPSAGAVHWRGRQLQRTRSSAGTPSSPERSSAGLVSSAHFVAALWTCDARFSRASSRYTPPVRRSQLATCVREKASLWPGVGAKSR